MGGFIGGMIAGAVVVLILGAVLSLNTPLTSKPVLVTSAPSVDAIDAPEVEAEVDGSGPDSDLVEVAPSALAAIDTPSDDLVDLDGIEPEADSRPEIGGATQGLENPGTNEATEVTVSTEAPTAPPAPAPVPASPQEDVEPVVVDATPPQPSQPKEEEIALLVPEDSEAPEQETPEQTELPREEVEPEPETTSLPSEEGTDEEISLEDNPIAVEGDEDTLPRKRARIASLPQIGGEEPAAAATLVGKRVLPLTERDAEPTETDENSDDPAAMTGKPIEDYAADFENPESKPLMSIILIDDEGAFGAEALKDFPYPLSFAVSPSDPDAAGKMARHREAGFEVLALADLPEAASAQDAEVSLSVWLETLPETVGILEGVESGIQGNRKLADQVAEIAGGTGRGIITQDNGLNTVQKLAARNGVPSSVVFRDFDGARQDPKVMRRFLDQAAFRAGQDGAVVMLGRLRPETISALLLWGLEDRGNRVAMAPISAVMKYEVQ
ncbi:divergent polysaccharide deacetylase family protein [Roseibium sp. RKSG952]|uniref:divergent polysaccharide deacetylase family protein n=1 Tax=Roseibium sp. RKSG952 TaxID=2529384 RepID=UPI0012BD7823|nr:divergent polysaccharide deacetylase family protein [Roseibium sp. RKSG952]